MTVPQLLLFVEEQERNRCRSMLDQYEAVANGAGTLFAAGPAEKWEKEITARLSAK